MFEGPLRSLQRAQRRLSVEAPGGPWVVKVGSWPTPAAPRAAVLKMMKPHWSPDPPDRITSTAGIFFSAWVDAVAVQKGILRYTMHALRLRSLPAYRLEARPFARAFRGRFRPTRSQWPHVTTALGPRTPFEGRLPCPPDRIEGEAVRLGLAFAPLAAIVEDLLAAARARSAFPSP